MGSVKDIVSIAEPTEKKSGLGKSKFSKRYSVFDWGEMPDHIPYADASRCMTAAYFFEQQNIVHQLQQEAHYHVQ